MTTVSRTGSSSPAAGVLAAEETHSSKRNWHCVAAGSPPLKKVQSTQWRSPHSSMDAIRAEAHSGAFQRASSPMSHAPVSAPDSGELLAPLMEGRSRRSSGVFPDRPGSQRPPTWEAHAYPCLGQSPHLCLPTLPPPPHYPCRRRCLRPFPSPSPSPPWRSLDSPGSPHLSTSCSVWQALGRVPATKRIGFAPRRRDRSSPSQSLAPACRRPRSGSPHTPLRTCPCAGRSYQPCPPSACLHAHQLAGTALCGCPGARGSVAAGVHSQVRGAGGAGTRGPFAPLDLACVRHSICRLSEYTARDAETTRPP